MGRSEMDLGTCICILLY